MHDAPLKQETKNFTNAASGWQCLVRGVAGAEGPLTTLDGNVAMVSPGEGKILCWNADEGLSEFAQTGGLPAGLQLHPDGSIWVADMRRGILRVEPNGRVGVVVGEFEGAPIRGCNDLAFDSLGNLYFTAPAGSSAAPGGAVGEVFCRLVTGEVRRMANGLAFPNGLAVAPGDGLVIFAETFTHRLFALHLNAPGDAPSARIWATLPHGENEKAGGDGMDFDEQGHLVATNYSRGTLEIYDPQGQHMRTIALPFKKCSNVHFFPPPDTRLLVTEHENDALWLWDYGVPGSPQFGWSTTAKSTDRSPSL